MGAIIGHLLVAITITWPLAIRLERVVLGTETSSTVPLFNMWTLAWTADRVPNGLSGWWDAPIFWPTTGAFARSEPQLPTGLIFASTDAIVDNIFVSYNLVLLLTLVLNGVLIAVLARRLGASAGPASCVGVLGQVLPFVAHELGVLQLVVLWPMAGTLAFVLGWTERQRVVDAALSGAFVGLTALCCGYYGLYLLVPIVLMPALFFGVGATRPPWRTVVRGGGAASIAAAFVAMPVLAQQQRLTEGDGWRRSTVEALSARWTDWQPGGPWWPGIVITMLGLSGAWVGRKQPAIRWLAATAIVAMIGSIGARLSLFGWNPWWSIADRVPGYDRMRSPFRFAALAQLSLVACSTPAVMLLWQQRRLFVFGPVVAAILLFPSERRLDDPPAVPSDAAIFLAGTGDRDPAVSLPVSPSGRASDFEPTVVAMLDGLHHGHPLVNGYTGLFPDGDAAFRQRLRGFPDKTSISALEQRGVRWAIVDTDWLTDRRRSRFADYGITVDYESEEATVVAIPAVPG